jgi:hypothetical protein
MNYLFYTYWISQGCKGKYKFIQIAFSVVVFLNAILLSFDGMAICLSGKPITISAFFSVLLFSYCLVNIAFAAFIRYEPDISKDKLKVENNLAVRRTAVKSEANKNWNTSNILPKKRYLPEIKSSPKSTMINNEIKSIPKAEETKKEEAEKNITTEKPVEESEKIHFSKEDFLKYRFKN